MSSCDDPYTILGVRPEASLTEVRRAYRRLAMQWHPDRNPSAQAENEFKRVQAAYQLCLDPQLLAQWQQAQERPAAADWSARAPVGDDLIQPLTLTLEEAAQGCRKTIELADHVTCSSCGGAGKLKHRHLVACHGCSGCGRVSAEGGRTLRCEACGGRGYVRETACEDCAGQGCCRETRILWVTVPPGMRSGERLRLAGQAPVSTSEAQRGLTGGDLYLEIALAAHPLFVLRGRELHCEVPVSIFRLLCGGSIEVPTLAGTTALEIFPHPPHALDYRLAGCGFPDKGGRAVADLVVHLQTVHPQGVSAEQTRLLERIETLLAADLDERAPQLAAFAQKMRARR